MKKLILSIIVVMFAFCAKAQVGYNYSQYDIGSGGALNFSMTDLTKPKMRYSGNINFTYNFSPYINYIIEFQAGTIAGDSLKYIPKTRFDNAYTAITFRAQVQLGEIMDYSSSSFNNAVKNFYVGAGVGVIYTDSQLAIDNSLEASDKSSNIMIPVKLGYEFKLFNSYDQPWMKVDFGYQYNYVFSDKLDALTSGKSRDAFTQFVVGVKFAIGGLTSYRKQISY